MAELGRWHERRRVIFDRKAAKAEHSLTSPTSRVRDSNSKMGPFAPK